MCQLRVLSYNIQAGIYTRRYSEYLTKSWKHLLPHRERLDNLNRIAHLVRGFDLVGLQEVDGGSLRSAFVNQIEYLARLGHFPYWYRQVNRNLGKFAQHSNGLLSRLRPNRVLEYRLPGLPGRGAVIAELPTSDGKILAICIVHLALGRRARRHQLRYIEQLTAAYPYLILMGDFNCDSKSPILRALVRKTQLQGLDGELRTFPSWRPKRNLDHILLSSNLRILDHRVIDYPLSDHLPISTTIALPEGVSIP